MRNVYCIGKQKYHLQAPFERTIISMSITPAVLKLKVFNYYVFPGNEYFYSGNTYIELVNGELQSTRALTPAVSLGRTTKASMAAYWNLFFFLKFLTKLSLYSRTLILLCQDSLTRREWILYSYNFIEYYHSVHIQHRVHKGMKGEKQENCQHLWSATIFFKEHH